jgi:predicted acyl esterase
MPGRPEEFVINLGQINHVFKNGHSTIVRVQSSWFPLIGQNPQKMPRIYLRRRTRTL